MNQSVHVVNLVSSMITLVFFFGDSKELESNKLKNLVHTWDHPTRLRSGFLH